MSSNKFLFDSELDYEEILDKIKFDSAFEIPKENEITISKKSTEIPIKTNYPRRIANSANRRSRKHTTKAFKTIQKRTLEKKKEKRKHVSFKSDFQEIVDIKSWKKYNVPSSSVYKLKLKYKSDDIKCGCVVF